MYAQIAVARPLVGELSYAIPPLLEGALEVGHAVFVPFGPRSETGYVVGFAEQIDVPPGKVRPITRLLDPLPLFTADQLRFFRWVADYYLVPLGMVISTATPSDIKARTLATLEPTDEGLEAITDRRAEGELALVLRELIARRGQTERGLKRGLEQEIDAPAVDKAVRALLRKGWIHRGEREIGGTRAVIQTAAMATDPATWRERLARPGARMVALVEALVRAGGPVDVRVLVAEQGASARSSLNRLVEAGVVQVAEREARHTLAEAPPLGASTPPNLNLDQRAALTALTAPGAEGTFLLFGVTGSGKTEVFLGAAQAALDLGRQVLVLVPEIGLTPQLVGRFKARFGEQVAVLHSGLTGSERLSEWRRIRAGDAQVAVGARSALFAPFRRLGLVVVDEEHDDSYKQDDGVPYSARDLAVVLGREHRCPTVLASATPSLESWHNAQQGRYQLLRLPKRATPRPVPQIEVVDLTEVEFPEGEARPVFAPVVVEAIDRCLLDGDQAIIMYNRRGYAPMVRCTSCQASYECPNCQISMTLHQRARVMSCHICGLSRPYTGECPVCGGELEELGKGTELVEEELARLFPDAPLGRMDADTTSVRGSHHTILQSFRDERTRLLVGTQMLAKGHDFPRVQVAVVVSADHGLRMPDFRAAERTWSLLVQLAGRAGRGDTPGRVFLQTWDPEHYAIQYLNDAAAFMAHELHIRESLRYPPFTRLALVRLSGPDRALVKERAEDLARTLRAALPRGKAVEILGAAPAALPFKVGRWHFQLVIRAKDVRVFRAFLRTQLPALRRSAAKGVRVSWDVDARNLM
ncbi:MAG: primosomal protein N' [Deltaproteobacteria bacterium]|nr:primosomal protein N' [Deltaproteobacteria bacterium]